MDDELVSSDEFKSFVDFQLKEYENISQAHFKTNEVLSSFYRYFLIVTAIPITTVGVSLINFVEKDINQNALYVAFIIFGITAVTLSSVGAAVIAYIEGLRLDAILYARTVNSIRAYFFKINEQSVFGKPVLPMDKSKPDYDSFGAGVIIYYACALLNSVYFGSGIVALSFEKGALLEDLTLNAWGPIGFVVAILTQHALRRFLIGKKLRNEI